MRTMQEDTIKLMSKLLARGLVTPEDLVSFSDEELAEFTSRYRHLIVPQSPDARMLSEEAIAQDAIRDVQRANADTDTARQLADTQRRRRSPPIQNLVDEGVLSREEAQRLIDERSLTDTYLLSDPPPDPRPGLETPTAPELPNLETHTESPKLPPMEFADPEMPPTLRRGMEAAEGAGIQLEDTLPEAMPELELQPREWLRNEGMKEAYEDMLREAEDADAAREYAVGREISQELEIEPGTAEMPEIPRGVADVPDDAYGQEFWSQFDDASEGVREQQAATTANQTAKAVDAATESGFQRRARETAAQVTERVTDASRKLTEGVADAVGTIRQGGAREATGKALRGILGNARETLGSSRWLRETWKRAGRTPYGRMTYVAAATVGAYLTMAGISRAVRGGVHTMSGTGPPGSYSEVYGYTRRHRPKTAGIVQDMWDRRSQHTTYGPGRAAYQQQQLFTP